jgi:NAD dependent epimerase/dehydratase
MKKILITGAGGFIGSHLTEKLTALGYEVRAFVRYNSENSWGWLDSSAYLEDIEIFAGDIRDYDSVRKAMDGCSQVFHLAALIGIPYSYHSPLAYIKTNIEGTYNILECARMLCAENVIITSTSETYGTAQFVPINEEHPLVGQSPYSASKIAADQLAISYYRSFGLPVKIVRPFNTYGQRQSARAIIPTIIAQILSGEKKIKVGNTFPTRDFTYVLDTVDGFIEIGKKNKLNGKVINIGTNTEISVKELVMLISNLCGIRTAITHEDERIRPDGSEVERLVCDNRKIFRNTKWRPKYSLKEGLQETIEWFEKNLQHYKAEIYNK